VEYEELLNLTETKVSYEMNEQLCKEFTEKEISDALFQMGPLKAPGPDGFPARFYQRHWETLRGDVVQAVRSFFVDGTMPPGINDTAIILIPRGNSPGELKDFCPISLCNVIYKIISKCLVNRPKPFLGDIISPGKCSMLVREGSDDARIQQVRAILGLERVDFEEKYLGLPTPKGRLKRGIFQP
jgi:hypothetical protein